MVKGVTIFWIALVAVIALGGAALFLVKPGPGTLDSFAQCVKDKGVVFYGAFWCPHCQNTKAMFGSSAKLLPYVECSTPDGQGQTQVCKDAAVESYPTWTRPGDSTRLSGERTLQEIAEFSGCPLPS